MPLNWQTRESFVYGPGLGAAKSGLKDTTKLDDVLRSLSSQGILAKAKINNMQQVVAKCPKVSISSKGVRMS